MTEEERQIVSMASIKLADGSQVTPERIAEAVGQLSVLYESGRVDPDAVRRELESRFAVTIGSVQILQDDSDHLPWLHNRRSQVQWHFWDRYELWLQKKGLPSAVIQSIDDLTDDVLGRLEDPEREGKWDRRGMVVGHVQSGKTANYAGLINKAVDAGYRLIIVLAGLNNNLRSQTQLRLDHDVIGYDSQILRAANQDLPGIGVGTVDSRWIVQSLTTSSEQGDFNKHRAVNYAPGGDPVLVVAKKWKSVLSNILAWLQTYAVPIDPEGRRRVLPNIPLLLIDDEADHASVNGRDVPRDENGDPLQEIEPSAINRLVRRILACFEKKAYIGYTATPFANIFIYPPTDGDIKSAYGEDLFPRSFIINLPTPSDYVGPVQVFGLSDDIHANTTGQQGYPVLRVVSDYADEIPPKHKKTWMPRTLPPSLQQAIRAFWLTCAARRARGHIDAHNSMLIHVTRFTAVQECLMSLVKDEVYALKRRFRLGDGDAIDLLSELRGLWESDFVPTTLEVQGVVSDPAITTLTWDQIEPHLRHVIESIQFKTVNGSAKDVLDYYEQKDGMTVIAVGGDKLSRGLTLEGLSVSYYLRSSTLYDTLLQMGRWFGYRHGYLDLCRLYLSSELRDWFGYITLAYEEMRRQFDEMVACGGTPLDYGLRIRTHPAGLQITAANKLRHSTKLRVSFEDSIVETWAFHRDAGIVERNVRHAESWVSSLKPHDAVKGGDFIWYGVSSQEIAEFLRGITVHPVVRKASPNMLIDFISRQSANGRLTNWTVALISNTSRGAKTVDVAGVGSVGLTVRADVKKDDPDKYEVNKSRIADNRAEALDLNPLQYQQALDITNRDRSERESVPLGSATREVRGPERGLLLIYLLDPRGPTNDPDASTPFTGFALSFPRIEGAIPVEYAVDKVYSQLFGEDA